MSEIFIFLKKQKVNYFQEFDFLEAEHDSVSETADSCFGWLTMRRQTQDGLGIEENEEGEDVVDEDEVTFLIILNLEDENCGENNVSRFSIFYFIN